MILLGFNTVNGKGCCNVKDSNKNATADYDSFNTVNGKGCCNEDANRNSDVKYDGFNTVNGKGCCNLLVLP